jgi:hypothetical protein
LLPAAAAAVADLSTTILPSAYLTPSPSFQSRRYKLDVDRGRGRSCGPQLCHAMDRLHHHQVRGRSARRRRRGLWSASAADTDVCPLASWAVWGAAFVQLCTMLGSSSSFDKGWRKAAIVFIFGAFGPAFGLLNVGLRLTRAVGPQSTRSPSDGRHGHECTRSCHQ